MRQLHPAHTSRRRWARPSPPRWALLALALVLVLGSAAKAPAMFSIDPLTGPRAPLNKDWIGRRSLAAGTPILVMAGHADSQGMAGAGTSGEAVDRFGAQPMVPGIRDELYWNWLTAERVVSLGRKRGLPISLYIPPERSIADGEDPRTNWSVGKEHVRRGGYAMEIHYDAYGPDGFGSGLIPPLHQLPSLLDESLAAAFGAFPFQFRGGLGAPRRGIAILEIGKLESPLETALRDPSSRDAALNAIAERVVLALEQGLSPRSRSLPTTSWANPATRP
ncbi:dehydrogenase [Synechococcus sp. J7-Johnson]|nr:dehydrogenase [Synechococcus sp. J7-Johnson]